MAATSVTVSGQATMAGGAAVASCIVTFDPDESMVNGGSAIVGADAVGDVNGNWSLSVGATDDSSTAPTTGKYNISVKDPESGELLDNFRAPVPHTITTTTIVALRLLAS